MLFVDDTNLFTPIEYPLIVEISNVDDIVNNEFEKNPWLINNKQITT